MSEEKSENLDSPIEETVEETTPEVETVETDPKGDEHTPQERQLHARLKKEEAKVAELEAQLKEDDDFVKKEDLAKENESLARKELEASDDPADKAILENWDEHAEIYGKVARRGKNSKDAIVEDLRDTNLLWSRNRVDKKPAQATEADIAAMRGTKAPSAPSKVEESGPKILRTGKKMDQWFPKAES